MEKILWSIWAGVTLMLLQVLGAYKAMIKAVKALFLFMVSNPAGTFLVLWIIFTLILIVWQIIRSANRFVEKERKEAESNIHKEN